jgi:hypothetical protein
VIERIKFAGLLAIVVLLSACSQAAPVPKAKPTRTPKPTFTFTRGTPTLVPAVSVTPVPVVTDAGSPAATPSAAATNAPSLTARGTVTPSPASSGQPTAAPSATGKATATPSATATAVPTKTPSPTATTVPTETTSPTATAMPCPPGYDLHIHSAPGFSACHPTGWVLSEQEDPEKATRWVYFDAPTSNRDTGEGLKVIALSVSPNATGKSGEEFLSSTALALIKQYSDFLVEWPYLVVVDERKGVEANYQVGLPFQMGRVPVIGWKAIFLVGDQQWVLEVVGRNEYSDELQSIRDEFVARFHFVPAQ